MGFGWGYGMGNYTGFPGYSFPYAGGGPGAPGFFPPGGPPEGKEGEDGEDTFEREHGEKEKESHGVTGFVKGMANGAVNLVKGMFTPEGLLMTAGTIGLTWATGGAILPLLGVVGLGTGAYQTLNGIAKGSAETAGEGFFNLGFGLLGFAGPQEITLNSGKYLLHSGVAEEVSTGGSFMKTLKAPFNLAKYQHEHNPKDMLNIYELSWKKLQESFSKLPGGAGAAGGSAMAAADATQYAPSAPSLEQAHEFGWHPQQWPDTPKELYEYVDKTPTRKEHYEDIKKHIKRLAKEVQDLNKVKESDEIQGVNEVKGGNEAKKQPVYAPKIHKALWDAQEKALQIHKSERENFLKSMNQLNEEERRLSWFSWLKSNEKELATTRNKRQQLIHDFLGKQANRHNEIMDIFGNLPEKYRAEYHPEPLSTQTKQTPLQNEVTQKLFHLTEFDRLDRDFVEWNYNTKLIDPGSLELNEPSYRAALARNPKHAERLQDLWNLKVLKSIEEFPDGTDGGFARYYKNHEGESFKLEEIANKAGGPEKIRSLKMETLTRLTNRTSDGWQLPMEDQHWLFQECVKDLYKDLPQSIKSFVPESENNNLYELQAQYKILSNMYPGNKLTSEQRVKLVKEFMDTQPEKSQNAQKAALINIHGSLKKLSKEDIELLKKEKAAIDRRIETFQRGDNKKTKGIENWIKRQEVLKKLLAKNGDPIGSLLRSQTDDSLKNIIAMDLGNISKKIKYATFLDRLKANLEKNTSQALAFEKLSPEEQETLSSMVGEILKPNSTFKDIDFNAVQFQQVPVLQQNALEQLLLQDAGLFNRMASAPQNRADRAKAWMKWMVEYPLGPNRARENYNENIRQAQNKHAANVFNHEVGDSTRVQASLAINPESIPSGQRLNVVNQPENHSTASPQASRPKPRGVMGRMKYWLTGK